MSQRRSIVELGELGEDQCLECIRAAAEFARDRIFSNAPTMHPQLI